MINTFNHLIGKDRSVILMNTFKYYKSIEDNISTLDFPEHKFNDLFKDTEELLKLDRIYNESIPYYYLNRYKYASENKPSYFDIEGNIELENTKSSNYPFDFEFYRRGYNITYISRDASDDEKLNPLKYPDYGKRLVKVHIYKYYAHWYVRFSIETNPYISVDQENRKVSVINAYNGQDRYYDIMERFNTTNSANDYINQTIEEKFSDGYMVTRVDDKISKYFYSKFGD